MVIEAGAAVWRAEQHLTLLLLPLLLELSREVLVVVVQHIAVTRKPTYRSHEEDLEIAASEIINCIKS